jgi:hypothetical protein
MKVFFDEQLNPRKGKPMKPLVPFVTIPLLLAGMAAEIAYVEGEPHPHARGPELPANVNQGPTGASQSNTSFHAMIMTNAEPPHLQENHG